MVFFATALFFTVWIDYRGYSTLKVLTVLLLGLGVICAKPFSN
jgi:hypothetical protein